MKETFIAQLLRFSPCCEQEATDRDLILSLLSGGADLTRREQLAAHLTASAWVVSPDRKMVLMAYHNLYNSWAWLGGHADGDWDLLNVAKKEVAEESGLQDLRILSDDMISVEVLTVDGHEKRGVYVPSHLHLNVTYLFEGNPNAPLRVKPDENSGVAWIPVEDIPVKSTEPWFVQRIYSKLTRKASAM